MAIPHISILVLLSLFLFLSLTPPSFSQKCHPNDKRALLQIKKTLNNAPILTTWEPKSVCCSGWTGVTCDKKTNRVYELRISNADLRLPIPTALGDLPYLRELSFYNTNLTGKIPRAISNLSNLESLDFRLNHLTGPVPAFLGHLKKLTYITLASNSLTGSIPASLSQLKRLDSLQLYDNKLTGNIPESFGDFRQKDFFLYLSDNRLSGPIPRKLADADFVGFDVSRNRLVGDLSFMFGKNKKLRAADFSSNLFEFDFTNVELSWQLVNLYLNNNMIYGSLPKDISSSAVTTLNVSYNRLCGPIPEFNRVQSFDISVFTHNKCLCGKPLPKCK